ncbi:hypothetical protein LB503_000020 [Fusarium chuoi]|nr:hypothetical protein LB503_000020 [Fusarium chuoi]
MAWPLSGSGLRIAQALGLHRQMTPGDPSDQPLNQQIQDRKRAWWAVYEIDTFCSMLYGFPLGFSDDDCNVEPLDPYDKYSGSTKNSRQTMAPSLLFYKCAMSRLSAIVKSALVELYGTRHGDRKRKDSLKGIFDKFAVLNERLQEWYGNLAPKLKFDSHASLSDVQVTRNRERTGQEFESHLFRLQALSLNLAYENAKILIHRPLLSFRLATSTSTNTANSNTDPFRLAMQECKEAALQISEVASTPYLLEASETYAVAVVSLHLLTAGVTLCISITVDPFVSNSAEAISGIRQLMQVQDLLKDRSIVAAQSLDITKRLMGLVMAKAGSDRPETAPVRSTYADVPPRYGSGNNSTAPKRGCTGPAPLPQANIDVNSPPKVNDGSITDTLSMSFADQDITVCADASVEDTIQEYEQGERRLRNNCQIL